jgi:MSHA biogenesis protein MshO
MTVRLARGFTLMEMVLTIVILGIIGTSFGIFIVPAVNAHQALQSRAALVDSAEIALRRMARDIRIALPNSVRVSSNASGFAIEMIPTVDGGRYCLTGDANCTAGTQELLIGSSDQDFDILGCFHSAFANAAGTTAYRLVIGDGTGAVYAASGTNAVMTASGTAITVSISDGGGSGSGACGTSSGSDTSYRHHVFLSSGQTFPNASGRRRVFVVQTPVTYVCDKGAGTLRRYSGYAISGAQPTPASPPAGGSALVTDKVDDCSVTTSTGTVQAQGFVSLTLSLTNSGETVKLFHQVQLDNSV